MDELERRLKADADAIQVKISPELKRRLDATVESTARVTPGSGRTQSTGSLWLASSLTGLAATLAVIVWMNWNSEVVELPPPTFADTPPVAEPTGFRGFPLSTETAVFTEPLQQELQNLQDDLEKARESVAEDLRGTF